MRRAASAAFVVLVLVACKHGSEPSRTTTRGAELGSPPNDEAVMRIATAHCERDLACGKIGQGKVHEDQPTCLERMGQLMSSQIGRNECPLGVHLSLVSNCVTDIQNTPCADSLEEVSSMSPSCRADTLCLSQ